MQSTYLVVGLGNPEEQYNGTRHNIGFELLDKIASKYQVKLQKKKKFFATVAVTEINGKRVILSKPLTYMNLSGEAVKKIVEYYNIAKEDIIVVVDDVDIPIGELRLKFCGGAGTHNGLKSIEEKLRSKAYARLKIGIGVEKIINLGEFVLEKFSPLERTVVDTMLQKALTCIEIFFEKGIEEAMNFANTRIRNV